jgi:hypothetical protein
MLVQQGPFLRPFIIGSAYPSICYIAIVNTMYCFTFQAEPCYVGRITAF